MLRQNLAADAIRRWKVFGKGSLENKFTFLGVEAPAWQGAKAPAYRDMPRFRNAARQDASAHKHVTLFLREPQGWAQSKSCSCAHEHE